MIQQLEKVQKYKSALVPSFISMTVTLLTFIASSYALTYKSGIEKQVIKDSLENIEKRLDYLDRNGTTGVDKRLTKIETELDWIKQSVSRIESKLDKN